MCKHRGINTGACCLPSQERFSNPDKAPVLPLNKSGDKALMKACLLGYPPTAHYPPTVWLCLLNRPPFTAASPPPLGGASLEPLVLQFLPLPLECGGMAQHFTSWPYTDPRAPPF